MNKSLESSKKLNYTLENSKPVAGHLPFTAARGRIEKALAERKFKEEEKEEG